MNLEAKENLEIKGKGIEIKNSDKVSIDSLYSEMYEEGRYYRRHELTSGTWYTVILLGILAAIVTVKSGNPSSILYTLFQNELYFIKLPIAIIVGIIGFNGIYSLYYSGKRYDFIRNNLDKLEPNNNNNNNRNSNPFKPSKYSITPRQCIMFNMFILTVIILILIFIEYSTNQM